MSRFYVYLFSLVVVFGSIVTDLLKQWGFIKYSFFVTSLPSRFIYEVAIMYCATFFLGLFLFRKIFALDKTNASKININLRINIGNTDRVNFLVFVYSIIYLVINYRLFTSAEVFRHSGNEILERISLLIFTAGIFIAASRPTGVNVVFLAWLLFVSTLYAASDGGRSAAIPFLVAAGAMIYNRNLVPGFSLGALGAVALAAAFKSRGLPSFENFWFTFGQLLINFDAPEISRVLIQYSFPGLDTVLVMTVIADRINDMSFYRILEFVAYYSPAPSGLFPANFFEQTSLNNILGISRDVIGINSDIYSESLFWFGYAGAIIVPLLLAFMSCMSFVAARSLFRGASYRSQLIAAVPVLWMLGGGMVFSLRAGSRFIWAIMILALVVHIIRSFMTRRTVARQLPTG